MLNGVKIKQNIVTTAKSRWVLVLYDCKNIMIQMFLLSSFPRCSGGRPATGSLAALCCETTVVQYT